MKTNTAPAARPALKAEPFAAWKAELVEAIRDAIKRIRKDGFYAAGPEHLRQVTRIPAGGPTGTNAAYYFKNDWFPEALAKLQGKDAAFILKEPRENYFLNRDGLYIA